MPKAIARGCIKGPRSIIEPAYPVARAAAARSHERLSRLLASAQIRSPKPVGIVELDALEHGINLAFWASLRREEGLSPRVSLAFIPSAQVEHPLLFESPLRLTPQSLTRIAPAMERPGIHLGVCWEDGELWAWGSANHLPAYCMVLEIIAPGLLVAKYSRSGELDKFLNIAVIESDEIKIIDQRVAELPDCPALLTPLLDSESQFRSDNSASVLIQLAVSMRAHGHGGTLLVVPSATQHWRESILTPLSYAVSPPFTAVKDGARHNIEGVAGLTAVDGATVIDDQFAVLAFGVKIVRRTGSHLVSQLIVTEPIEGAAPAIVDPSQMGGTRHFSAAQFAHDHPDSISLVASQDGRFTAFGWSPTEGMVHALRLEALLV